MRKIPYIFLKNIFRVRFGCWRAFDISEIIFNQSSDLFDVPELKNRRNEDSENNVKVIETKCIIILCNDPHGNAKWQIYPVEAVVTIFTIFYHCIIISLLNPTLGWKMLPMSTLGAWTRSSVNVFWSYIRNHIQWRSIHITTRDLMNFWTNASEKVSQPAHDDTLYGFRCFTFAAHSNIFFAACIRVACSERNNVVIIHSIFKYFLL